MAEIEQKQLPPLDQLHKMDHSRNKAAVAEYRTVGLNGVVPELVAATFVLFDVGTPCDAETALTPAIYNFLDSLRSAAAAAAAAAAVAYAAEVEAAGVDLVA